MSVLKKVNLVRRILMKNLTRNVGRSSENLSSDEKSGIKKILISRPNHRLGNLLLITPLIQEVTRIFPDCKIDLFVKGGLAPIVFKNYENINRIIALPKKHFKQLPQYFTGWASLKKNRYDLVINVVEGSSSGRLATQIANSKLKFFGEDERNLQNEDPEYKHIAKSPIYSLRHFLAKMEIESPEKQIPVLDLKLSPTEIKEGKKILRKLVEKEEKTICLFTNATGAKCYSDDWWMTFYNKLKINYPHLNILEILPVENISRISFKEPSFYSRDIREMGAVIANTDVFIGADSGIMHLASASKIPTIGLFSVTNPFIYKPYNPGSVGLNTNKVSVDEIIAEINKIINK